MKPTCSIVSICLVLIVATLAAGHDTPIQPPSPQSPGEAWNVIEQSRANVDALIRANLLRDSGAQLVNIATALRALDAQSASAPKAQEIHQLSEKLVAAEADLL